MPDSIIFDFDALFEATRGPVEEPEIADDDLECGQACPRAGCAGHVDAAVDPDSGCTCFLGHPPCGGCCPGVLICDGCKEVFRYE